jgi:hypothetical protein
MSNTPITDLKNLPELSYDQRESARHVVDVLRAQTKYLESLKGVDPKLLREERRAKSHWTDRFPWWLTLWIFYLGAWVFLLMTFKKDVWPR